MYNCVSKLFWFHQFTNPFQLNVSELSPHPYPYHFCTLGEKLRLINLFVLDFRGLLIYIADLCLIGVENLSSIAIGL